MGSGWAEAADALGAPDWESPIDALPGFAASAVVGHAGKVRSVTVGGNKVLVFLGRTHLYEGRGVAVGGARRAYRGGQRREDRRAHQRLRRPALGHAAPASRC